MTARWPAGRPAPPSSATRTCARPTAGARSSAGSRSTCGAASCSRCSARTARARRRRSRSSRATGGPTAASARVLGLDPARDGRRLRPRIGLMLQEGGDRQPVDAARGPPAVRPLLPRPGGPGRLLDAVDLGQAAGDPLPAPVGRREAAPRRSPSRSSAGPELLVLDEPTAGMDPAAKQATRERIAALRAAGHDDPADDPRARRRRAARRPGRGPRPRTDRRGGTPAELTGGGAPRLRFRLSAPLDGRRGGRAARRSSRARRRARRSSRRAATGAGLRASTASAAPPDPRLVAALAAWCADARTAARRAAGRGGEPRGAVPRARRRRPRARPHDAAGRLTSAPADDARVLGAGDAGAPGIVAGDGASPSPRHELRLALRRGEGLLITFVIPVGVLLVFSAFDHGAAAGAAGRRPPAARRDRPRGDRRRVRLARDRDRLRAPVRRHQAARRAARRASSAVVAAKTAAVIVVELVQLVLLVGIAVAVARLVGRARRPPRARDPRRARPRHGRVRRASGCSSPGRSAPRRRWPSRTCCSSCSSCWAASSCRSTACPTPSRGRRRAAARRADPGARDRARARPGDAGRLLALLAGWAVVLVALAAWRFRWD